VRRHRTLKQKWALVSLNNQLTVIATLVIALATVVNLGVAVAMWNEMRKSGTDTHDLAVAANQQAKNTQDQTTIMRQQLVGTQAAVFTLQPPQWDSEFRKLTLVLSNDGDINGTVIDFSSKVQRKTLPELSPIGDAVSIEFSNQLIAKNQNHQPTEILPWPLPEIDVNLWPGNQVVTFEGHFTYNDGFDDKITKNFCYFWLPHWYVHVLTANGAGWAGGGWKGGEPPCLIVGEENTFHFAKRKVAELTRQH
jgi:hypothetical protein